MKQDNQKKLPQIDQKQISAKFSHAKYMLVLDYGGTFIKVGVFKLPNISKLFIFARIPSQKYSKTYLQEMQKKLKKLLNEHNLSLDDISMFGIAINGPIYPGNKLLFGVNKCGFPDKFPINKELSTMFKNLVVKTHCLNDSAAAIYGEYVYYYQDEYKKLPLVGYTIGTHIGGCIIINNEIYHGAHNHAGEFGHGAVKGKAKMHCFCGLPACMGSQSSALATEILLRKDINFNTDSPLAMLRNELQRDLNLNDLCKFIQDTNNLYARIFLRNVMKTIAAHIAKLIFDFDPALILIGGTISSYDDILYNAIYENMRDLVWSKYLATCTIKCCKLQAEAGLYGAAFNALKNNNLLLA